MEYSNYVFDNYNITLFLINNAINIKIINNNNFQHYLCVITKDLIKSNQINENMLFKIIKNCLLEKNENYKITFIDKGNVILMYIEFKIIYSYDFHEQFIFNKIVLPVVNPIDELQKQIQEIKNENLELKLIVKNLQQEINNLEDCKFYVKVDNLISKTIDDINQAYKNNLVFIDTKNTNNKQLNEIIICTNDEKYYNEIKNNNFINLIKNFKCNDTNLFVILHNFMITIKNNFIKNIDNKYTYENKQIEITNIIPSTTQYPNGCYSYIHSGNNPINFTINNITSLFNLNHIILCETIINSANKFKEELNEILNNYVNEMIELYK
jgi:hypothetical protein